MSRQEIYREITEMFGLVPEFIQKIPDNSLEYEWNLMKQVQFVEGPIPNKYRELIGLGIAAVSKCRYCALFHTEVAKLNGATDAEIKKDAVQFLDAKLSQPICDIRKIRFNKTHSARITNKPSGGFFQGLRILIAGDHGRPRLL